MWIKIWCVVGGSLWGVFRFCVNQLEHVSHCVYGFFVFNEISFVVCPLSPDFMVYGGGLLEGSGDVVLCECGWVWCGGVCSWYEGLQEMWWECVKVVVL